MVARIEVVARGENPVGNWTIRISDLENENNGTFLGWNMVLWGSAIDPAKSTKFELINTPNIFPPKDSPHNPIATASTKSHPRPTSHLPGDHGTAEGDNKNPAFSSVSATPTTTTRPTGIEALDEGWFSDMSKLISSQKWFFGAITVVLLFGIGAGIFFWRRRAARRVAYSNLAETEEVTMNTFGGGQSGSRRDGARTARTRQLYDAFGEVSDDEDADEHTGLRPREQSPPVGLGFHSGFLDDDDPSSAAGLASAPVYRDEPDEEEHREEREVARGAEGRISGAASPNGSGGWVHATRE